MENKKHQEKRNASSKVNSSNQPRRFDSHNRSSRRLRARRGFLGEMPVKASNFVRHYKPKRGDQAVTYARASAREQFYRKSLDNQLKFLRLKLRRGGVHILKEFREIGSGWSDDLARLVAAARYAKKHNAALVAESADRFLRSLHFKHTATNPILPCAEEWSVLREKCGGVEFCTLLSPDMPWKKVRSLQTKRGSRVRCRPGEKKERREELMAQVSRMKFEDGLSCGQIIRKMGVPRSTVRDWIRKTKKGGAVFFTAL